MKRSDELIALEAQYGAHNYAPLPVVLARAEGIHVWDVDGKRYTDMLGAYSAVSHGHCHPKLVAALNEQAQQLDVVSRAFHAEGLGAFLARACEVTGLEAALAMNSGTEAVETALKLARKWAYTVKGVADDKARIVVCNGNFHGRSITIVGFSSTPQYSAGFGPYADAFDRVPFGDAAALEAAITTDTAAFLVEPIQGEGGINVPPAGYLRQCAEICRRHNVLLICDEIQTGLGRTGRVLASEHDGVVPDIVTLGKALGGGLVPVSLVLSGRAIMDVFQPGDHGSTFGGYPLASAVGRAALDVMVEEKLAENSAALGDYLLERLRALDHGLIVEVRGKGLFAGVEFEAGKVNAHDVCVRLLAHGILTKETHRNTVRFAPPLIITRDQIDEAMESIAAAIGEIAG